MKKHYDKLIRDRIPEIIEGTGKTYEVRPTLPHEMKDYAHNKLREEVEEFIENPCAAEAADILEILNFICKRNGIPDSLIRAEKVAKRCTRGGFERGLILEWVEDT